MNGTGLQQWLTGTVDVTVSQAAGANTNLHEYPNADPARGLNVASNIGCSLTQIFTNARMPTPLVASMPSRTLYVLAHYS